jgi:TfoX/Sxy family transcriptional regulator of competence genes
MAYDAGLAERIREVLQDTPGISERSMFGGLAFLLHGHMFVGISGESLMARIGPERYEEALAKEHVRVMDFTGRPMKGYVFVDAKGLEADADLELWVKACAAFVASLPPKALK